MLSRHWPLLGLQLRTPGLELRPPDDRELAALADVARLREALKVAEHCMDREQSEPSALNIVREALAARPADGTEGT